MTFGGVGWFCLPEQLRRWLVPHDDPPLESDPTYSLRLPCPGWPSQLLQPSFFIGLGWVILFHLSQSLFSVSLLKCYGVNGRVSPKWLTIAKLQGKKIKEKKRLSFPFWSYYFCYCHLRVPHTFQWHFSPEVNPKTSRYIIEKLL